MDKMIAQALQFKEQHKYASAWLNKAEQASQCAKPLVTWVECSIPDKSKILEIGCGDGTTARALENSYKEFDYHPIDITSAGLKYYFPNFKLVPMWALPYDDKEFDYTISTDVLEHLPPEIVEASIKEILRVTKTKTFHCIATFPDNREGYTFHLSVHPVSKWNEWFLRYNVNNIEIELIDREDFLRLWKTK